MQATGCAMGYRENNGMVVDMDFFGAYVKNMRTIPSAAKGCNEEKATQKEIFEIIDDYIEQA